MADEVRLGPFRTEQGWVGIFTREEAPGALPNGTRIEKTGAEPDDYHGDGAKGTILGSVTAEDCAQHLGQKPGGGSELAYFVEWDNMPKYAVGISQRRVKKITQWHSKTQ